MVEFIIIGGIFLIVGGFGSLLYIEQKKVLEKKKQENLEKQKEIAEIKRKHLEEQTRKMQEMLRANLAKAEEEQKQRYKEAVEKAKKVLGNVDASVERVECVVGSERAYAKGGHGNSKLMSWEFSRTFESEDTVNTARTFTRIPKPKVVHKHEVSNDDLDYLDYLEDDTND